MTISNKPDEENDVALTSPEEEAALWMLALEEAPDDEAISARFDIWLNADPAHRCAFDDVDHVRQLMLALEPEDVLCEAQLSPTSRPGAYGETGMGKTNLVDWAGRTRAGLAALLAASLALFLMLPALNIHWGADYVTATGETLALTLADGSKVTLGPRSAISLRFEKGERGISLLTGEAFFDVARDPERPFKVDAGAVRTTVLGTAFDVRRTDDLVEIAVAHGEVAVTDRHRASASATHLRRGDGVRIDAAGHPIRFDVKATTIAAWREGRLLARDRRFAEMLDQLRRSHPGWIVVIDKDLRDARLSGSYSLEDPHAALQAMVTPLGGKTHQISPWVTVVSAH